MLFCFQGNANGAMPKTSTVSAKSKVKTDNNNVDESWLEGTNALTAVSLG